MSISKFFTGGGLAALAAALVVTAIPAEAKDYGGSRAERQSAEASRVGNRQAQQPRAERSWNRGSQQAQPTQRQQQPQRSWDRGGQQAAQQQAQAAQQRAQAAQQRAGRDWNRSDRSGREWNRGGGNAQAQAQAQAQVRAQQQAQAEAQVRAQRQQRDWNATRNGGTVSRSWERNGTYANRDRNQTYNRNNDRNWRDNDRRGQAYAYRNGNRDNRQWDRRWRDNNRYNWHSYRNANRSVYRLGSYYAPYRGYNYRRLSIGIFLDNLFYSNRYWINDPWQYRLPDVYGPYRWVRYYDDALLVDVYSGEVVDVIYDFFW